MTLETTVKTNVLGSDRLIGSLYEQELVFVAVVRQVREGVLTSIEEVKREAPSLSQKGLNTVSILLHSQAEGRNEANFWSTYDSLACRYSPLKEWRALIATSSSPGTGVGATPALPEVTVNLFSQITFDSLDESSVEGADTPAADGADQSCPQASWLWQNRIPLSTLSLIDGDNNRVMSLLMLDLAARVSSGKAMPCLPPGMSEGAGVVLITPYNNRRDFMGPRLQEAGADFNRIADLSRVAAPDPVTGEVSERFFSLAQDLPHLEQVIDYTQAKLVVINPLEVAFGGYDIQNDIHVHQLVLPLLDLVQRKQIACILMRDVGYLAHKDLPLRGYGALTLVNLSSSALKIDQHPNNNMHIRLTHYRNSYGEPAPTLRFSVENDRQLSFGNTVKNTSLCQEEIPCGISSSLYASSGSDKVPSIRWHGATRNGRKG